MVGTGTRGDSEVEVAAALPGPGLQRTAAETGQPWACHQAHKAGGTRTRGMLRRRRNNPLHRPSTAKNNHSSRKYHDGRGCEPTTLCCARRGLCEPKEVFPQGSALRSRLAAADGGEQTYNHRTRRAITEAKSGARPGRDHSKSRRCSIASQAASKRLSQRQLHRITAATGALSCTVNRTHVHSVRRRDKARHPSAQLQATPRPRKNSGRICSQAHARCRVTSRNSR